VRADRVSQRLHHSHGMRGGYRWHGSDGFPAAQRFAQRLPQRIDCTHSGGTSIVRGRRRGPLDGEVVGTVPSVRAAGSVPAMDTRTMYQLPPVAPEDSPVWQDPAH
jgi:hypothetical protein